VGFLWNRNDPNGLPSLSLIESYVIQWKNENPKKTFDPRGVFKDYTLTRDETARFLDWWKERWPVDADLFPNIEEELKRIEDLKTEE